ncbi:MAG: Wzy polymerase domain-containing protein [Methylobacter sp.]|nr:Wzy polymerase domain-containing protein [Methylobacter sp.]
MEKNLKPNLYLWSLRGSLTMLALLPVLPLFSPWHLMPVASFHSEWLAIILGLLAWLAAMPILLRVAGLQAPRMILLPLALMALISVQAQLLPQVISQHAQMAMLYLLWAALLMALIGLLAEQTSRARVGIWLASGLTAAAACGGLQEFAFRLNGVVGWWGGIAQANNYGDLLALGLASALYLLTVAKPVWRIYLLVLAAVIVFGLSLTPSRSVWLYWLVMMLIAWRWQRPQLRLLLPGMGLYLLLQILWSIEILPAQQTAAGRLYQEVGGAPVRLHIWNVAWHLFMQAPWLGQGFGQFDWAYFQAGQHIPDLVQRLEHAHNLVLHLLAELGILPVLLLLALLGLWLRQVVVELNGQGRNKTTDGSGAFLVWLLMLAAILGLHSLLEYPLWYAQFLGIAAMILALGDSRFWQIRLGKIGIWAVSGMLAMGIAVAAVHEWHYAKMERALYSFFDDTSPRKFSQLLTICQRANVQAPLLTPYIAVIFTLAGDSVNEKLRPDLTALVNASYQFLPVKELVYRQAEMQALSGSTEEARRTLRLALIAYPYWAEQFVDELDLLNADDQKKVVFLRGMAEAAASHRVSK